MRLARKLTAATALSLLLAGCGSNSAGAFTQGFLTFQKATNRMATAITPLEKDVTASKGNVARMSQAFAVLGAREQSLADHFDRMLHVP